MRRRTECGFTLTEAIIAMGLMAILMAVAVPSFNDAALGSQLRAAANDLAASAHLARSEAIKRNVPITLCVSTDAVTCTAGGWEQGWIVAIGPTVIHRQSPAPNGLRIRAGAVTSLSFQPTGAGATPATFTICRATPSVGHEERVVTIQSTGRPEVRRTTNAACS